MGCSESSQDAMPIAPIQSAARRWGSANTIRCEWLKPSGSPMCTACAAPSEIGHGALLGATGVNDLVPGRFHKASATSASARSRRSPGCASAAFRNTLLSTARSFSKLARALPRHAHGGRRRPRLALGGSGGRGPSRSAGGNDPGGASAALVRLHMSVAAAATAAGPLLMQPSAWLLILVTDPQGVRAAVLGDGWGGGATVSSRSPPWRSPGAAPPPLQSAGAG